MAIRHDFTKEQGIFRGEDKFIDFEIFDADRVTPKDVATFAMEWLLRLRNAATPALRKTTGGSPGGITVIGVFNMVRAQNTQHVRVTLTDGDTEALAAETYRHALKRTDEGSKTILSHGDFVLMRAAAV